MKGEPKTEGGFEGNGCCGDGELGLATLDDGEDGATAGEGSDGDFLLHVGTSRQEGGVRDFDGGAVDFEGHVGVIPLVLHFEHIAFEPNLALDTGKELTGEGANVCEGLEGVDGVRENGRGALTIEVFEVNFASSPFGDREEHAEADAIL